MILGLEEDVPLHVFFNIVIESRADSITNDAENKQHLVFREWDRVEVRGHSEHRNHETKENLQI